MSFAHQIKTEICHNRPFCQRNKKALAYGLLLFGKSFSEKLIALHTEHRIVARLYADSISDLAELSQSITVREVKREGRRSIYVVTVDSPVDRAALLRVFGAQETPRIEPSMLSESAFAAFISGAFLACGSVSDPEKGYHAEFSTSEQEMAAGLERLLADSLSPPKTTVRRNNYLLYYKESEQIEDLLTLIGAPRCAMDLMEVKIVKNLRNKVNRETNCETANISKTIDAAVSQMEDIRLIQSTCGLQALDDDLWELAVLRLENPDLSLRELGERLPYAISRSGVNHRLKRICAFAAGLRGKQ